MTTPTGSPPPIFDSPEGLQFDMSPLGNTGQAAAAEGRTARIASRHILNIEDTSNDLSAWRSQARERIGAESPFYPVTEGAAAESRATTPAIQIPTPEIDGVHLENISESEEAPVEYRAEYSYLNKEGAILIRTKQSIDLQNRAQVIGKIVALLADIQVNSPHNTRHENANDSVAFAITRHTLSLHNFNQSVNSADVNEVLVEGYQQRNDAIFYLANFSEEPNVTPEITGQFR